MFSFIFQTIIKTIQTQDRQQLNKQIINSNSFEKMRKKQSNSYPLPPLLNQPPYLSPQQVSQFESQFSLFDSKLDLRKLKQSFSLLNSASVSLPLTLPPNQNYKPVQLFVNLLANKKDKCTFEEYITAMTDYLLKQDDWDFFIDMLGDGKRAVLQRVLLELLEESMGREILKKQFTQIMRKVFQIDNQSQEVTKKHIINLMLNANAKN